MERRRRRVVRLPRLYRSRRCARGTGPPPVDGFGRRATSRRRTPSDGRPAVRGGSLPRCLRRRERCAPRPFQPPRQAALAIEHDDLDWRPALQYRKCPSAQLLRSDALGSPHIAPSTSLASPGPPPRFHTRAVSRAMSSCLHPEWRSMCPLASLESFPNPRRWSASAADAGSQSLRRRCLSRYPHSKLSPKRGCRGQGRSSTTGARRDCCRASTCPDIRIPEEHERIRRAGSEAIPSFAGDCGLLAAPSQRLRDVSIPSAVRLPTSRLESARFRSAFGRVRRVACGFTKPRGNDHCHSTISSGAVPG